MRFEPNNNPQSISPRLRSKRKSEIPVDVRNDDPHSNIKISSELDSCRNLRRRGKTVNSVPKRSDVDVKSDVDNYGDIIGEGNDNNSDKKDDGEIDVLETTETDDDDGEDDEEFNPKRKYKTSNMRKSRATSAATLEAREHDEIIKKFMKLKCDICSIDLADYKDLRNHFRTIHNRVGYVICCNRKLKSRRQTVDHINNHNNPEYFKCRECGKVMVDRTSMSRHMLAMHATDEEKIFPCPYCPKKFASGQLLELHSARHTPKDKCPFVCNDCGQRYLTISLLNYHIKQVHLTKKDIMCEICAKLFRLRPAFEQHMEEHRGIVHPQVQCEICGTWLKHKHSLQKHMHNKHELKEYICNICGRHSTSRTALKSHIKYMHESQHCFKCSSCEKSFKTAIKLKEHVATHTGIALYTCPYCPTKFNARSSMHMHRKKAHREQWERDGRFLKKEQK